MTFGGAAWQETAGSVLETWTKTTNATTEDDEMKQTRTRHWMTAAVVAAGLAVAGAAGADDVTTNTYDETSTSDNIALSCAELDVSSDELSAKCNRSVDGEVTQVEADFDIKNAIICVRSLDGGWEFAWKGAATPVGVTPARLDVDVSSNGEHYLLEGKCQTSQLILDAIGLVLDDTNNGLENDDGALARR